MRTNSTFHLLGGAHQVACRILVPWSETKPTSPGVEVQTFNHWPAREVPKFMIFTKLKGEKLYLILVLFCISLVINEAERVFFSSPANPWFKSLPNCWYSPWQHFQNFSHLLIQYVLFPINKSPMLLLTEYIFSFWAPTPVAIYKHHEHEQICVYLYTSLTHMNINTLLLKFKKWVGTEIPPVVWAPSFGNHYPKGFDILWWKREERRWSWSHTHIPFFMRKTTSERSRPNVTLTGGSCSIATVYFTIWCRKEKLGLDLQHCWEPPVGLGETTPTHLALGSPICKMQKLEEMTWNLFQVWRQGMSTLPLRTESSGLETFAPTWVPGSGLVVGGSSPCQQASCHRQRTDT